MFKKIKDLLYTKDLLAIIFIISVVIFLLVVIIANLLAHNRLIIFTQIMIFIMIIFHYLCTMGNQSIFYGYFQSWEWKASWKDNDLRRIAGEHTSIIKNALINFIIVCSVVIGIVYSLYHFKLLNFYPFDNIVWFSQDALSDYITNIRVFSVYWYMILGISLLFFSMIFYFLIYNKYPSYNDDNTPLFGRSSLANREATIRNTYTLSIFIGLMICYILFNKLFIIRGLALLFIPCVVTIFSSRIYWLFNIFWIYPICVFVFWKIGGTDTIVLILSYLIPIALLGISLIVVISIGVVLVNWIFKKHDTECEEYNKLSEKMKPWLGFNSRFVSESFIDGKIYDFKELYELTNVKKKWLFWIEYFFANILNRNVKTLLSHKNLLWLTVIFNVSNSANGKSLRFSVPPEYLRGYGSEGYGNEEDALTKRKTVIEVQETLKRSRIEDPEGDVFLNMELEGDIVENTKPSIYLPFYVTGIIYLNVIPYYLVYNVVMLLVFTKYIDMLVVKEIELLNGLLYGWTGILILVFMGFLLSIFMNNMSVWMAWRKYYRLKKQGNNDALFFSIFKQRVIYQYMYEYQKDEDGNVVTVNYEEGLYPQFNLAKLNELAKELSPRYYDLYNSKFPFL